MTAWIVLGVILLVLCLLGAIPATVDVSLRMDAGFTAKLRLLGFSFSLFPPKEKHPKQKHGKKKPQEEKKTSPDKRKETSSGRDFAELLGALRSFLDPLPTFLRLLRRGIRIRKFRVIWRIATDDAADTAIAYGRACSLFYPVLAIVDGLFDLSIERIRIYPDFLHEESFYSVSFRVRIRVWRLIFGSVRYLVSAVINLAKAHFKQKPQPVSGGAKQKGAKEHE